MKGGNHTMTIQDAELTGKIREIEAKIRNRVIKIPKRIAVFDLDNTLITHDIGEAVFARLKQAEQDEPLTVDRKPIPLSWSEYRELVCRGEKKEAYKKMVTAMSGLPLNTLQNITRQIIRSGTGSIKIAGHSVPVPRANRRMQFLIRLLKRLHYRIFIISASNHTSVRIAADMLLNIPESNAFGIQSRIIDRKLPGKKAQLRLLTSDLIKPIPISRGKVSVYKKYIDSAPPLVTAGDSEMDIHLLNFTHKEGLSIWVGKDPGQYNLILSQAKNPGTFFFLEH
jgi:phosphoserine phosphatase